MSPAGVQAADTAEQAATYEIAAAADGPGEEADRSRRLLRAVEHYKAACAADGVAPDAADTWLVLLAALDAERHTAE